VASDIADDRMVVPFFEALLRRFYRLLLVRPRYVCCDGGPTRQSGRLRAGPGCPCGIASSGQGKPGDGIELGELPRVRVYVAKLPPQRAMGDRMSGVRTVHRPNVQRFDRVRGKSVSTTRPSRSTCSSS